MKQTLAKASADSSTCRVNRLLGLSGNFVKLRHAAGIPDLVRLVGNTDSAHSDNANRYWINMW
eukprot:CAMPEP_0114263592 /NCGR_PEP_ID=MMETSP0058-20121206/22625_1 /TAXON_ID=36894 /ORGANISM="Pyramimonas parkeae, CCMP726" /LENGTH=62 /DNA_ID=CAMNT_0001379949 /DNA_START=965 /DNA_END=1150 /DNA_ORIENTATION=+